MFEFTLEGLIFILFNLFKFYVFLVYQEFLSCVLYIYQRYVGFRFIFNNNIQWARWLGYSSLWITDLLEYLYWKSILISTHFLQIVSTNIRYIIWMHYHIYMHLGLRSSLYQFHTNLYLVFRWLIFYGLDSEFFMGRKSLFRNEFNFIVPRILNLIRTHI